MTKSPRRRVVSLWLPRFASDRWRRRQTASGRGKPPDTRHNPPLAMIAAERGGVRVVAVNRSAEAAGVTPGLSLAAAGALCADLITAEADPEGDRRALAALADWCGRYTPWTALDESGGIWLEITGCGHLFGGEAELLADLRRRLDGFGYAHVAAVAETPGAAWAAARYAPIADTTLASLPVAALRLPPATVEGLQRLGLRRVGDLTRLPRAPLGARFGPHPLKRLDQALGRRPEIIEPRRPTPAFRTRLAFAEPLIHRGGIDAALKRALDCLCRQMTTAEQGARRLSFTLYRGDGSISEAVIGTSRPNRDPVRLERLFLEKLERLDPGFGVDVAILAATAVDPLAPVQGDLTSAGAETEIAVDHLLDRLGNRLGANRVLRLTTRASHLPERAQRTVSALDAPPRRADIPSTHAPRTPRPLRLLATPELIEVVAQAPDHPPALFRWRRCQHRVAGAEGPERIGSEWWRNDPAELASSDHSQSRDYYRIEDTDGGRFWVFRNGPYRPDRPPRWYLHGFFS